MYFIRRDEVVEPLVAISKKAAARERRLACPDWAAALEAYFEKLRQDGVSLPRLDRRPNQVAVAESCGIGRHVFATPLGRAMRESFDAEDRERYAIEQVDHASVLRGYLQTFAEAGQSLPRVGDKVNKVAIAAACGFHRNILYDDSEIWDLLKQQATYKNLCLTRQ